jgi:hypothetical protein
MPRKAVDPKWKQAVDDVVGSLLAGELRACLLIGEPPMLEEKGPDIRKSVESHLEAAIKIWKDAHGESVCDGDRCRHYALLSANAVRAGSAGVVNSVSEFYERLRFKVDRYLDTRS